MNRIILHSDADSYYASVECLYTLPCGGGPWRYAAARTTGTASCWPRANRPSAWASKPAWPYGRPRRCVLPCNACPRISIYTCTSVKSSRRIYQAYTDKVEPFGLDECWLDVSAAGMDWAQGERLAHAIRRRIRRETGLTVSIGVSDNKVFAKLASDYKSRMP